PRPNAAGWNNTPTVASFVVDDTLTPVASITPAVMASAATAALTVPAGGRSFLIDDLHTIIDPKIVVTDTVGNSTTSDQIVNVDRIKPSVVPSRTPAPNANGWNNSLPVTIAWSIIDNPPATCAPGRGICQASGLKSVGTMACAAGSCVPGQLPPGACSVAGACAGAPPTGSGWQGATHGSAQAGGLAW